MIGQGAIAPLAAVFDYSQLTEDCQGELFAAAERIKTRVKRQTIDHIEIGRELLKVKDQLEHGVFLEWIAAEFPFSARSAQRYMAAAEFAGDEYDSLSHLPAELLYDLASKTTPDAIKNEVRADLGAGKPVDVQAVKGKIKDARWQRRDEERKTRGRRGKPVSEATRRRHEREEARRQEEITRREAEKKARAGEIIAIFRKLPEPDFERLLELLNTASLWAVQDMLNRSRA
jgi:hypothetical protein